MAVANSDSSSFLFSCLACPHCKAGLSLQGDTLDCSGCERSYSVQQDIPVFAEPQTAPNSSDDENVAFRKRYEWQYQQDSSASAYDESFRSSARKRQRTRRELHIMQQLLASQGHSQRLLDVPCGGGRLSGPIAQACDELIEADIAPAQLSLAMSVHEKNNSNTQIAGMVASAIQIPLDDGCVDGAICARLTHHLPDPQERSALVAELFRVAKKFVIFSFTDKASIQSWSRKIRGKALNPSAMSRDEVNTIAESQGARVKAIMTVSNIGPRHRFVLLEK